MKNADDMLKAVIKVVDTNGDDKIQYEGKFRRPNRTSCSRGILCGPHQ